MLEEVSVFHSSIRIPFEKVIYFDPYKIESETHDADIIFITHDHFDHYSKEDIDKVIKDTTVVVAPSSMRGEVSYNNVLFVEPDQTYEVLEIKFQTVRAYNVNKMFHPKKNGWLGYVVTINSSTYYVAGDTDITEDAKNVKCDVAFIPCGGTYTMNFKEAAELANIICPKIAIPTHYGAVAGSKDDGNKFVSLLNKEIQGIVKIK